MQQCFAKPAYYTYYSLLCCATPIATIVYMFVYMVAMRDVIISDVINVVESTDYTYLSLTVFTAHRAIIGSVHPSVRPSVRLSVCPSSVTFRCFVETNEATIMWFSPTGRTIILVSEEVKILWKIADEEEPVTSELKCGDRFSQAKIDQ